MFLLGTLSERGLYGSGGAEGALCSAAREEQVKQQRADDEENEGEDGRGEQRLVKKAAALPLDTACF